MIKFSGLSRKKANQSDPRLAWFAFHKIYPMYTDIKNKEESNSSVLLTSVSEQK